MNAVTSTIALPKPTTAAAASATAYSGTTPITARGTPHSTTAIASQRVMARLPTSSVQAALPTSAPMPTAPWSTPTSDSPRPSRSMATTTTNTVKAPRMTVCRTTKKKTTQTPSFSETARTPSRISPRIRRLLTGTGTRSYFRPSTRTAERRPHTPANTNTDATSETLTSTAATNGPTTTLNESSRPRTTLMDVSSSGARQSNGIRAEWLARYGVKAMVETIASA